MKCDMYSEWNTVPPQNELRIEICYKMDGQLIQTFIIVSEIRQAQKDKYCMLPLV